MARPKGSVNKRSSAARLQLAKMKVDPLARTAECAKILFDDGDIKEAGKLFSDLIPYLHPKLAAMQVSQDEDSPVTFNITVGPK